MPRSRIYDDQGRDPLDAHPGRGARRCLVEQWAKDTAADAATSPALCLPTPMPTWTGSTATFAPCAGARRTRRGPAFADRARHVRDFAAGDRLQFTGTDKKQRISQRRGRHSADDRGQRRSRCGSTDDGEASGRFDAEEFQDFRHGYAGTIYKGQGRTLDQTYLYHSEHWRSAASYVALTRHRDKAELFVARNTAADVKQLARQMARVDDRRAASHFHQADRKPEPVRPLTPRELAARLNVSESHPLDRRADRQARSVA